MAPVIIPDQKRENILSDVSGTGPFAFTFVWFKKEDLRVFVDGVELALEDFTATPGSTLDGGYDGGSITLDTAVTNAQIVISSMVRPDRTTDFSTGGARINQVNEALDKIHAILRDLVTRADRSVQLPAGDNSPSPVLPSVSERAGKIEAWSVDGTTKEFVTRADVEAIAEITAQISSVAANLPALLRVADQAVIDDVNLLAVQEVIDAMGALADADVLESIDTIKADLDLGAASLIRQAITAAQNAASAANTADAARTEAQAARDLAEAWASNDRDDYPDPSGSPNVQSSKTYALDAGQSAAISGVGSALVKQRFLGSYANATAALADNPFAVLGAVYYNTTDSALHWVNSLSPAGSVSTTDFIASVAALKGAPPGTLDTLEKIADAIGDDPNYAAAVTSALALKAPLASPALTGTPTAPTPTLGDDSTKIATTAFVLANAPSLDVASQAEAEAGTDNTKAMTPLRTNQAILQFPAVHIPDAERSAAYFGIDGTGGGASDLTAFQNICGEINAGNLKRLMLGAGRIDLPVDGASGVLPTIDMDDFAIVGRGAGATRLVIPNGANLSGSLFKVGVAKGVGGADDANDVLFSDFSIEFEGTVTAAHTDYLFLINWANTWRLLNLTCRGVGNIMRVLTGGVGWVQNCYFRVEHAASANHASNVAPFYLNDTAVFRFLDNTFYAPIPGNANAFGSTVRMTATAGGNIDTAIFRGNEFNWFQYDMIDATGSGGTLEDPVLDRNLTTAPVSPAAGDRYIIAGTGGGWSGFTVGSIAEWNGSSWVETAPTSLMRTWVIDEDIGVQWNGSAWSALPACDGRPHHIHIYKDTGDTDSATNIEIVDNVALDHTTAAAVLFQSHSANVDSNSRNIKIERNRITTDRGFGVEIRDVSTDTANNARAGFSIDGNYIVMQDDAAIRCVGDILNGARISRNKITERAGYPLAIPAAIEVSGDGFLVEGNTVHSDNETPDALRTEIFCDVTDGDADNYVIGFNWAPKIPRYVREPATYTNQYGRRIIIDPDEMGRVVTPSRQGFFRDNFYGLDNAAPNADFWRVFKGSDGATKTPYIDELEGGLLTLEIPNTTTKTMAVNGACMTGAGVFRPLRDFVIEAQVTLNDITDAVMCFGVSQSASLHMPLRVDSSDVVAHNLNHVGGFIFDTSSTTPNWFVGTATTTLTHGEDTGVEQTNNSYKLLQMWVKTDGSVEFRINGKLVSTAPAGALNDQVFYPYFGGFSRSGGWFGRMDFFSVSMLGLRPGGVT